jgi:anti-sigma factor RsiW
MEDHQDSQLSTLVKAQATYHRAPPGLHRRVAAALDQADSARAPWWSSWQPWLRAGATFAAGVVISVAVMQFYQRSGADDRLAQEILDSHVRSLMVGHLADVASSDQHTVKPWFSARLPFSPAVTDFPASGFELVGGRLDTLGGEPVAVMVYKRRQHVIDVYVGRGETATRGFTQDGFNVEQFGATGLRYYAVSDLNRNELADFVGLLRKSGG